MGRKGRTDKVCKRCGGRVWEQGNGEWWCVVHGDQYEPAMTVEEAASELFPRSLDVPRAWACPACGDVVSVRGKGNHVRWHRVRGEG